MMDVRTIVRLVDLNGSKQCKSLFSREATASASVKRMRWWVVFFATLTLTVIGCSEAAVVAAAGAPHQAPSTAALETEATGSTHLSRFDSNPYRERIVFHAGEVSATRRAIVASGSRRQYVLRALAGQIMSVWIESPHENVLLSIVGADGVPLKRYVDGSPHWAGKLHATQDYTIHAVSVGSDNSYFTLHVYVEPLVQRPEPAEWIRFNAGEVGTTREGIVRKNSVKEYVLRARAAQMMMVNATGHGAPIGIEVTAPDGRKYRGHRSASNYYEVALWLELPLDGDYHVTVSAPVETTRYDIEFTIENSVPPSSPTPVRINFPRGSTGTSLDAFMRAGGDSKRYVLNARAGQTMNVHVTAYQTEVRFTVASPGEVTWLSNAYGSEVYFNALTLILPESGDYIITATTPNAAGATRFDLGVTIQ